MTSLKIPDEYSSGGKPLSPVREDVALGVCSLCIQLADTTIKDKELQKELGISQNDNKEQNRAGLELCMFNLFAASRWILGNVKDNPEEILDRMYYHFRSAISENDMEFGLIVTQRTMAYDRALHNNAGLGPMFHVGLAAVQYAMGRDEPDIRKVMPIVVGFNNIFLRSADAIKQFVSPKLK